MSGTCFMLILNTAIQDMETVSKSPDRCRLPLPGLPSVDKSWDESVEIMCRWSDDRGQP